MQYVGFLLIALALAGLAFGLLQHLKGKKLAAAPFHKTGHVASNPDSADTKGMVSAEGAVHMPQPLIAPCSGKPCVYFEVTVERLWEKSVNTENGVKTEKGTSNVRTDKGGARFWLDDGSGPVTVDARESVAADLKQSFTQTQNVSSGDVGFGTAYRVSVAPSFGDERVTGVRAVEKIVPAEGNMYVLGKLSNGVIAKSDGLLGKLQMHSEGRDHLLGQTKRNARIGLAAGAALLVGGTAAAAFGDKPADTSCQALLDATPDKVECSDRLYNDDGNTFTWKVSKPGTYALSLAQPPVKNPIFGRITVTDASGKTVAKAVGAGKGAATLVAAPFAAGEYKINVRDDVDGYVKTVKGGFGYSLNVDYKGPAPGDASKPVASSPTTPNSSPVTAAAPLGKPLKGAAPKATVAKGAPAKGAPAKGAASH